MKSDVVGIYLCGNKRHARLPAVNFIRMVRAKTPHLENPRGWHLARATVTGCRHTLMSSIFVENPDNLGYSGSNTPEYIVSFSYSVAGVTYRGSYRAGAPSREGHHFEISYDPNNPARNTGTSFMDTGLGWLVIALLGCIGAAIALWFSNK
jgi:hypothetical protein